MTYSALRAECTWGRPIGERPKSSLPIPSFGRRGMVGVRLSKPDHSHDFLKRIKMNNSIELSGAPETVELATVRSIDLNRVATRTERDLLVHYGYRGR